jgi:hypothetical protein
MPATVILNPEQIASWFRWNARTPEPPAPMIASIPKLQRGLVWNPSQIELLWDSLLRGFPIGSLVVCPRIPGQDDGDDPSVTHHLLDGQQRSHAISLGYHDPFAVAEAVESPRVQSILWIDLQPEVPVGSTREFLVRLTTSAHPWGFRRSDSCEPLHAWQIREILATAGLNPASPDYVRPTPERLQPMDAAVPIPVAWLIDEDPVNPDLFWRSVRHRCESKEAPWAKAVCQFLTDTSDTTENARRILFAALQRLRKTAVVALPAPDSLVRATRCETNASMSAGENSAIEHLFQRLNRQGTRLDGEELAYSMIKAYWPQVAKPVQDIVVRRMPASRLVMMAARAALTPVGSSRLRGPLSVSDIRSLALKRDQDATRVLHFIESRLKSCCEWIENALLFDPSTHPEGLLPVHLANIARSNPEVYLLLLRLADDHLEEGASAESLDHLRPALLAMVMRLSWFAVDSHQAVNHILSACSEGVIASALREAINSAEQEGWLQEPPPPMELAKFLDFKDEKVESWTWYSPIHGDGNERDVELRQRRWGAVLQSLGNRDLLLYAQRGFITRRFADFDPSRRDLWEGHNRPWDFDHLHARALVNNLKSANQYQRFLKQWLDTIGNLRAWPFEDNRSDSAEAACAKITTSDQLNDSFLLPSEIPVFSMGRQAMSDETAARTFANACLNRMIRIYKECWDHLA